MLLFINKYGYSLFLMSSKDRRRRDTSTISPAPACHVTRWPHVVAATLMSTWRSAPRTLDHRRSLPCQKSCVWHAYANLVKCVSNVAICLPVLHVWLSSRSVQYAGNRSLRATTSQALQIPATPPEMAMSAVATTLMSTWRWMPATRMVVHRKRRDHSYAQHAPAVAMPLPLSIA